MSDAHFGNTNTERKRKKIFHGKGLELNKNFMEWWSEARKSEEPPTPYEFLTNFGIIGDSESHSMKELFWKILLNSPGTPGQSDYYAHYMKDALATDPTGYTDFESLYPSTGDPNSLLDVINDQGHDVTERDIKSLIQVVPPLKVDLTRCIQRNYSLDLVNCLFEKTPVGSELNLTFDTENRMDNDRQVLDKSLMLVVQKHIGKIKSIECFDDGDNNGFLWTKDAFAQFLGMMMQSEAPSKFDFYVPEKFHTGVDGENALDLCQTLPDKEVVSSIEDLTICLSRKMEALNPAVLELVPRMAALKELEVSLVPRLKSAAPYLVQSLQSATVLEKLSIEDDSNTNDPTVANSLLAILEALRTNSSVVKFSYWRLESEAGMELCESTILDILKFDNSTLRWVKLGVYGYSCMTFVKAVRNKIDYYLMLNQCGRQKAREPELQLAEFVCLLGDVNGKVLGDNQALSVLFGLLHEQPGSWNGVSSIESRKRNRSNQESCKQKLYHVAS